MELVLPIFRVMISLLGEFDGSVTFFNKLILSLELCLLFPVCFVVFAFGASLWISWVPIVFIVFAWICHGIVCRTST